MTTPLFRRSLRRRRLLAASAALAVALTGAVTTTATAATPDCSQYPWMDTSLSPDDRATSLLEASTLHQKYRWLVEQPANNPQQTTFSGVTYPAQVPCTPTVIYTDGADAVRRAPGTTAFPAPIAMAATWNPELVEAKSAAQAVESFENRRNVILGPGIASGRTPLSGRNSEYFGEDPILSGVLGAAAVAGIEDNDEDIAVLANLKHFVANEQELDRQSSSSNIDERTLRELYVLPYEIAIREGSPESIMCSFNQINGVWACEHPVLQQVLKDEIGFDGYVMSDFGSVHSTAPSLVNGMDQELNRPRLLTPALLDAAIASGELTEADIDEAAFRVVRSYIRGGLFDTPLPAAVNPASSTDEHKAIARQLAEQGTVLLKNDGVLPLEVGDGDTIALFGPTASATATNGVNAQSICSMTNRNATTSICEAVVAPDVAFAERAAEDGASVTWNAGTDLAEAASQAAAADVAIVFGYKRMGEFADPADLGLDGSSDELIAAVAAANPNTIVIVEAGSAVEMPWIDEVAGVFHAWYPGEQQGPALAALAFGDVNPSGKLPMTIPASLADTPTSTPERYPGVFSNGSTTRPPGSTEIRQVEYSEGLQVGYRWYEAQGIEPLFPFGYGLSDTEFEYSHVQVTPKSTDGAKEIRVRFRLTNTGDVAGTEIAQVYVTLPGSAGEPSQRLVDWVRVDLQPGEHRNIEVTLTPAELADRHLLQYWDADADRWVTPSGTFGVTVGGSVDAAESATFRIR